MVKRKRSYRRSGPRRYSKRRSTSISTSALAKALGKINNPTEPYGPGTARWEQYGPSDAQMRTMSGQGRSASQNFSRAANSYRGDGDYLSDLGRWGSRLGGAALGGLGGFATGGIDGAVAGINPGYKRGANFSRMMGWGDYSTGMVNNQIAAGGSNAESAVYMNPNDDMSGDVVISQREFIGNVTCPAATSTEFNVTSYPLNPGISPTFPFLSQIAKNYELYEFIGCGFQYIPTTGESSSASNNLGKVILATNYDPSASDFRSSIEMQNYDYANSAKPSVGLFHGIETATNKRATDMLYVRGNDISRDKVFTDIGNFQVATEGIPTSGTGDMIIGELWITYKVRLSRAKLADSLGDALMQTTTWTTTSTDFLSDVVVPADGGPSKLAEIRNSPSFPGDRVCVLFNQGKTFVGMIVRVDFIYIESIIATTNVYTIPFGSLVDVEYVPIVYGDTVVDSIATDKRTLSAAVTASCYLRILSKDAAFDILPGVKYFGFAKVTLSVCDSTLEDGTLTAPL